MKNTKGLILAVLALCVLTGCSKFSPKETAVSVGKEGTVTAAVIDTLDQSYYDGEELKASVEESVAEYNAGAGEDTITVEEFEIGEEKDVKLFMEYASYNVGDITDGYNNGGYRFETTFCQVEKGEAVEGEIKREEIFAGANHPMVVFSESMAVEVPGEILYVSSNVEVTGKKSARMAGTGTENETETEPASESTAETEGDVQEITPVVESDTEGEEKTALAYIIYE